MIDLEIFGFVGPTQSRKGPQARGEPGVEGVRVLLERAVAGRALGRRGDADHGMPALIETLPSHAADAIPHGHTMPKPNLSTHIPVTKVVDPMEVRCDKTIRDNVHGI